MLRGVKNQMSMLLSSKSQVYLVSRKSYPGPSLIKFHLKSNDISKSVRGLPNVIPSQLFQEIGLKSKHIVSSRLSFQSNDSETA